MAVKFPSISLPCDICCISGGNQIGSKTFLQINNLSRKITQSFFRIIFCLIIGLGSIFQLKNENKPLVNFEDDDEGEDWSRSKESFTQQLQRVMLDYLQDLSDTEPSLLVSFPHKERGFCFFLSFIFCTKYPREIGATLYIYSSPQLRGRLQNYTMLV